MGIFVIKREFFILRDLGIFIRWGGGVIGVFEDIE